jgi:membrane dipeptidase
MMVSEAPVIFSHSSARGLTDHPRNVPDDVLDMLLENKGIVMVTFIPAFISEELHQHTANRSAERSRLEYLFVGQPDSVNLKFREWNENNPAPVSTLSDVADHIDYIRNRIGIDHIGIGGDYDGIPLLPNGLEDVSTYPDLFAELLVRGYSESDLKKIAGLNILRVMRDAEDIAERLRQVRPPSEAVITDFQD